MSEWMEEVEALSDELNDLCFTQRRLNQALKGLVRSSESPFSGIAFGIQVKEPFESRSVGSEGVGDPDFVHTVDGLDQYGTTGKIRLWRARGSDRREVSAEFDFGRISDRLGTVLRRYWKGGLRDQKTRLVNLFNEKIYQVLNNSLKVLTHEHSYVAVLFCDLDHFKEVNDRLSMSEGDRVILEFASIVDSTVSPSAFPVHRSGDEFIIIAPVKRRHDSLLIAKELMESVRGHDFKVGDIPVDMASGIAFLDDAEEMASLSEIEKLAEQAIKPGGGGEKKRGRARFYNSAGVSIPHDCEYSRSLSFCRLKANVASAAPFPSPWLNLVSDTVVEATKPHLDWNEAKRRVADCLEWSDCEFCLDLVSAVADDRAEYRVAEFAMPDLLHAVAHGVYRSIFEASAENEEVATEYTEKSVQVAYVDGNQRGRVTLEPGQRVLFDTIAEGDDVDVADFGSFVFAEASVDQTTVESRPALIVKIGHEALGISGSLFADTIIVDDRPTKGGGLPDFWEASIARLISTIATNPNLSHVFVVGNLDYGTRTVRKLEAFNESRIELEQIAEKTGISLQDVRQASERLTSGVSFPRSTENLVEQYSFTLRTPRTIVSVDKAKSGSEGDDRFLRRDLKTEEVTLERTDGCRVTTAAKAFPIVLEIVRKAKTQERIYDQAGQELRELIDFKVELTEPTLDPVPGYYGEEEESLDDYFQSEFLDEEGLFGEQLRRGDQLDAVLNHVVATISASGRNFTTRRAILVVPHIVRDPDDISPLGLVSVRIIPRFLRGQINLSYSYTWRTVEALVGFPYSLYGSIQFSEHLTKMVKARCDQEVANRLVISRLTYIAHSLHIFMDDYGQNIARRIVDDASI